MSSNFRYDASVLEVGQILEDKKRGEEYKIIEILGKGGFGIVYRVYRVKDKKEFAIKELLISDKNMCQRKRRDTKILSKDTAVFNLFKEKVKKEVTFLSKNKNKNRVDLYNYFEINNTIYTVMEYIKGDDLERIICDEAVPFTEDDVYNLLTQLHNGFKDFHDKGIIHRDIKPNNIIRTVDGVYKLIDFTNIKMFIKDNTTETISTIIANSPLSPPELLNDVKSIPIGVHSDIYSLGMTIYCCFKGEIKVPSYYNRQGDDIFEREINGLSISRKYKKLIKKMTKLNYKDRFKSLDEVLKYIKRRPTPKKEERREKRKRGKNRVKRTNFYTLIQNIPIPNNLTKILGAIFLILAIYLIFKDEQQKGMCDTSSKMKICIDRYKEIAFNEHPNILYLSEFEKLVKSGIPIDDIKNSSNETALNHLAFKGAYDFAKVLVDNGIDVNIKDNNGETALYEAVAYYPKHRTVSIKLIDLLIKNGADVTIRRDIRDRESILSLAVKFKLLSLVKELADKGVCSIEKGRIYGNIGDIYDVANSKKIYIGKHRKVLDKIKDILKKKGC